jgi:hypothetical protein
MRVRGLTREVLRSFRENDLGNFASAMAFRVVPALVPFLLFVLALLGFLHLQEAWGSDDTARQVLSQKQLWWLTAGLALGAAMGVCLVGAIAIVRFGPARRQPVPGSASAPVWSSCRGC